MSGAGAAFVLLFAGLAVAVDAGAAFESPRIDAATLGLGGSQPAWPGGPGGDAARPIGPARTARRGLRVAAGRWDGLGDLASDAAALWSTHGALAVSLAAAQRRGGVYVETEAAVGLARPAREVGRWGWGVEASWGRWAIEGSEAGGGAPESPESPEVGSLGRSGPGLALALGARVSEALSLAARWREWGGGLATDAPGHVEAGLAARLGSWTYAVALESGSPGRSLRTLVSAEVALRGRLRLRGGLRPGSGETAMGLGIDAARLTVDLARRAHPRLGAHVAVGVTLAAGREP
jgi:hypothetical protein